MNLFSPPTIRVFSWDGRDITHLRGTPSYEQVLEFIRCGRFHYFLLLVCGLCLMSVVIEALNMSFTLPFLRCDMVIPEALLGLVASAGFIGIIVSAHAWGFLADTWGRIRVLRTALAMTLGFSVLSSLSVHWVMLGISRFVVGCGLAGLQTAAIVYMGEFHSNLNRPLFVTLAAGFLPTGTLYQPMLALLLLPKQFDVPLWGALTFTPWRLYILGSTSIVAFTLASMLWLPESPKFLLIMGRKREALEVLRRIWCINSGQPAEVEKSFPVTDIAIDAVGVDLAKIKSLSDVLRLMWNQTWPLFIPPRLWRMLLLCFNLAMLFFVSHGFYMWFPTMFDLYLPVSGEAGSLCDGVTIEKDSIARSIDWIRPQITHLIDQFNTIDLHLLKNGEDFQHFRSAEVTCPNVANTRVYEMISLMGAIFVLFYAVLSVLLRPVGKQICFTTWIALIAVAMFLVTLTNAHLPNMVMLTVLASGASCGSGISANVVHAFPSEFRGMAMCLLMLSCRVGAVIGSNVIGQSVFHHCTPLFLCCAVLTCICVPINYVLMHTPDYSWLAEKTGDSKGPDKKVTYKI